jgi:HEXXH motif-containing protein
MLRARAAGLRADIPRELILEGLHSPTPGRDEPRLARFQGALLRWQPAVTMSMEVTDCDPLIVLTARAPRGPKEHAVVTLAPAEMERYVSVLRATIDAIAAVDHALAAEIADSIRVVVPLSRPDPKVHVSSTYDHLPGAIFLCHDEDPILQGETLVHEAAHNKLNALLAREAVFESGGEEAVYFSPWRPDPRPLRGLLLGAHAFLNVARFLALAAGTRESRKLRAPVQTEAAMRCLQVELALDALGAHGRMTPLGRDLLAGMRRSVDGIRDKDLPPGPGGIWGAAREPVERHKELYLDAASFRHRQA